MTEATHFSQCVHDQQRRLEADDCDSIQCAQLISGGRRRIRPPCTVPRSRSPHNVLHSPSLVVCADCMLAMVYIAVLVCTQFLSTLMSPFRLSSLFSLTCHSLFSSILGFCDCILLGGNQQEISILEKCVSYVRSSFSVCI